MSQKPALLKLLFVSLILLLSAPAALAQGSAFTYQGRLTDGGTAPTGSYEMEFRLFDAASGGTQQPQPSPVTIQFTGAQAVAVTDGVFTVQLDFGADAFPGAARYLEISVRQADAAAGGSLTSTRTHGSGVRQTNDPVAFTTLSPRQPITATPYAIRSLSAETAATAATAASATTAATATTATTATTALSVSSSAGDSVVTAVNAGSSSISTAHVSGDVELAPAAQQTATTANDLVNLKLVGTTTLGTSGTSDLLSLSASGDYSTGALDQEWFRVDNAGGVLAQGTWDGENEVVGVGTVPAEGNGTRLMWYGAKGAFRAGYTNNGSWDNGNIGQGSFAAGMNNRASGRLSSAFGNSNVVSGTQSVATGSNNTVSGTNSFAHGSLNTISGNNATALGSQNTIGSSANSGAFAFGLLSQANASQAFAIGERATVGSTRAMVISLGPSFGVATNDAGTGTFTVRAANGIYFGTNTGTPSITSGRFIETSTGAYLTSTGVWTNTSDRNVKESFIPVNGEEVLRRLKGVPMTTWKYRADPAGVRHLGPMAQDFAAAFGLGDSDKAISTVDASGVALAAAQALDARTAAQQSRIGELEQQVRQQQEQIDALKKLLCLGHGDAPVCKEGR
jgi:hypothetical protein